MRGVNTTPVYPLNKPLIDSILKCNEIHYTLGHIIIILDHKTELIQVFFVLINHVFNSQQHVSVLNVFNVHTVAEPGTFHRGGQAEGSTRFGVAKKSVSRSVFLRGMVLHRG